MNTTLIDQFLNAVTQWSKKTGKDTFGIMIISLGDIGAIHYFAERPKNSGSGFDFRAYLINLVEQTNISQSLLISGLVTVIDIHLAHYAKSYESWRQQAQKSADILKSMADDPELRGWWIREYNEHRISQGLQPIAVDDFNLLGGADYFMSKANDVDDNEAERKMQLLAWREIVTPLLDYANLWPIMKKDIDELPKWRDD